ncbi:MAG: TIGR02147 family protein [Bdellovibrionales bacterium]
MTKKKKQEFRIFVQDELLRRCRDNPRYSLRAFAKALGIVPSALSDILNGKRPVTVATRERLGLALGLKLEELNQYGISSKANSAAGATSIRSEFQQITLDTYAIISDWYHYAILELIKVKGFKPDPKWIAKSLSITKNEANFAIERLVRVGLLEVEPSGQWRDLTQDSYATNISGNLTSEASRKLQKQILEKSIIALQEVEPQERNHTSMTMAINSKYLPEATERIKNFRRELCKYLENKPEPNQIYHLGISLYPVTNIKENSNEKDN